MRQSTDIYGAPELYQNDEKWVIRIFRPILTKEERARREKRIHDAAVDVVKEAMRKEKVS